MQITRLARPIRLGRAGRDTPKIHEKARPRHAFLYAPGVLHNHTLQASVECPQQAHGLEKESLVQSLADSSICLAANNFKKHTWRLKVEFSLHLS